MGVDLWRQSLKERFLTQSPVVWQFQAQGYAEGKEEGKAEGKVEALIQILEIRSGPLPSDLIATIRAIFGGQSGLWKQALTGGNTLQSQQVLEWQAGPRAEGNVKGKAEGRAEAVLQVLESRFGSLPPELVAYLHALTDLTLLRQLLNLTVTAPSLAEFRQTTGL